jgi:hypothetical protein
MFNEKISLMPVTSLIEKPGGVKKSLAFKRCLYLKQGRLHCSGIGTASAEKE